MKASTTTKTKVPPTKKGKETMRTQLKTSSDTTTNTTTPTIQLQVGKIDRTLTEKAVSALLKYHTDTIEKKNKESGKVPLLESNDVVPIQVQFGLEVPISNQKRIKPIRIHIPHSIYQLSSSTEEQEEEDKNNQLLDEAEICMIVKDDTTKTYILEMKEQFPQYMKSITKVTTLQSLRTKYCTEYNKRRLLLHSYTHFITDDRILPMLTSILGKDFIQVKKQPIPISVTRKSVLPHSIQRAILHATYLFISDGTCITIRCGYTSQSIQYIVDNIIAICEQVPNKATNSSNGNNKNKSTLKTQPWVNIRNICIKLPNSMALPIYNQTPSELIEIAKMAGIPSIWVSDSDNKNKNKNKDSNKEKKVQKDKEMNKSTDDQTKNPTEESDPSTKTTKGNTKKKSPLLKALELQKKETIDSKTTLGSSNTTTTNKDNNKDNITKKRKVNDTVTTKVDEAKIDTKEKVGSDSNSSSNNKKNTKKKEENKKEGTKAAVTSSPMKKIKTTTTDTNTDDNTKLSFIASKKFNGIKQGYKYQLGKNGLGYYIDQLPKITFTPKTNNNNNNDRRRSTISPSASSKSSRFSNNNNKKQRRSR